MNYRKKLIEVALPLEAINLASAREKSIRHGHPSTLHLWWSRKPLATARAVIFTSLVDDPDSSDALPAFVEACRTLPYIGKNVHTNGDTPRMRLFDFIEVLVQWESTTDEAVMKVARELIQIATEGNPPPLFDPFAGGGSIPLEAQRLGLETYASDLNPVAVMINKAQIEIPPRFANVPPVNPLDRQRMNSDEGWKGATGLAADVSYYGEWIREKAWERIGHLYPLCNDETVIAWLWTRTVMTPNPAVSLYVPLSNKFQLSKKTNKEYWAKPIVDLQNREVRFEVQKGIAASSEDGTVNRKGGKCVATGVPIPFDYIREEGKAGRMRNQLMAIVTEGNKERNYYSPQEDHVLTATSAIPAWKPNYPLPHNPRDFKTQNYGLNTFADLFTSRQLVALSTFSDLVSEVVEQIYRDGLEVFNSEADVPLREGGRGARAYAEAVSVYLTFAVDRSADFWSSLAIWANQPKNEVVMHTFGRQALPMIWDFAEANPFSKSGGNWLSNLSYIIKMLESMQGFTLGGTSKQSDAAGVTFLSDGMVSTDPPYYDNIGYADLSDYFYVWMRNSLKSVYPDIFGTLLVPKEAEISASPYRYDGDREKAQQHFEETFAGAFANVRKNYHALAPLTIYYAFKQSESESGEEVGEQIVSNTGWETMLSGLIDTGFTILGTWPVRTERTGRMLSIGTNALASSIVLVCRPRLDDAPIISRRAFVDALRRELPTALKNLQSGNIAPVDLAQASIGPSMAIYSRYSKVLEADGSPLSVRTALGIINQELDTYLAEQDGDIDSDTRFAIAWFEQFGFNEGEFGLADNLARAKNTSVEGISRAGLVHSGRGKVSLIHWKEYDAGLWNPNEDHRPTIWEATHHLIERLNTHGEKGSAMLMTQMPSDMAAEARNLAYRLYSICERKGWSDHAQDYNALVISWAEIGDVAAKMRNEAVEGTATEQGRLFE